MNKSWRETIVALKSQTQKIQKLVYMVNACTTLLCFAPSFLYVYWNGTKLPQSLSSSSISYNDCPAETFLVGLAVNGNATETASCTVVVVAPWRLVLLLPPRIVRVAAGILVRDDDRRWKESGRGLRLLTNGGWSRWRLLVTPPRGEDVSSSTINDVVPAVISVLPEVIDKESFSSSSITIGDDENCRWRCCRHRCPRRTRLLVLVICGCNWWLWWCGSWSSFSLKSDGRPGAVIGAAM